MNEPSTVSWSTAIPYERIPIQTVWRPQPGDVRQPKPLPIFENAGTRELTWEQEPLGQAWWKCTVHVLPHRWFAVTDKRGRFSLPRLPDGEYGLVAVHELLGKITKKIRIHGKPRKPVTFVFKVPEKLRAKPTTKKGR